VPACTGDGQLSLNCFPTPFLAREASKGLSATEVGVETSEISAACPVTPFRECHTTDGLEA
jgi:hypothetical protein